MTRRLTTLALGLALLLVTAGPAPAQDEPVAQAAPVEERPAAPLAPAQEPTTPEALPQEDDEELGEEIPEDEDQEGQESDEPGGGNSGGPPPAPQPATPGEPRASGLPRTGADALPLLVGGMLFLGCGLLLWALLGREHPQA